MEALPPQDLGTVHETEQKVRDDEVSPLSVRQVSELAATSNNSNEAPQADEREKLMRAPPRRGVSRHKSGGGPGGAASGNFRKKPQLLRAQSMRVQLPPISSSSSEPHRGTLSRARSSAGGSRGARPGPGRTNSQMRKPLQRAISQGSESGGLRPYRGREQVVNQSIQRMDSSNLSIGDMSAFSMGTMDSVSLRKAQIVADPLDDQTYNEGASFADHDSISMMSDFPDYTEFLPGQLTASSHNPRRQFRNEDSMSGSFCTLDSVQLRQKQNHDADHCDASFSTIESRDLCFEANKEFDEYSCLDEYSSRELLDNVEVLKEEENEHDYEDDGDDDDDELLNLGNVVIDDSDDEGELLEEDEDDDEEEKEHILPS